MDYEDFIASKALTSPDSGFDPGDGISDVLFGFQRDIVRWACKGGRRAIFAAFGLGKSLMQLELMRLIGDREGGRQLIVCPLGVRQEFRRDAKLVQGCQPKDVAREYGYCVSNIYRYMAAEGIPRRDKRLWTDREDELIRRHYPAHGASWDGWARLMPERKPGRQSVTWRARKLGVRYEGRSSH